MTYKIWEYSVGRTPLPDEPPYDLDFKTGLDRRLHKEFTFVQGEVTEIIYYAEFDGVTASIPVVRSTFSYDRDATTGLANFRTETIQWYDESEAIGEDSKVLTKYYATIQAKRMEIGRKRNNMIDTASGAAILGQILTGTDQTTATTNGQALWATLVEDIQHYLDGDINPLINNISTNTTAWLDAAPAAWGGATIRMAMLAEL